MLKSCATGWRFDCGAWSSATASITAVNGLDLDVPEGTCVGLLGPNGAGKSTTMRLLTAQAIADEGELEVLGFRLPEESKAARAECGVAPQLDNLDVTLDRRAEPARLHAPLPHRRSERRAAIEPRSRWPTSPTGATPAWTSSRAGCAGGSHRARARPPARGSSSSTSPPWGSTPRCARSSGRSSTRSARRDDDPHVDPLHRGGRAPRGHRADHVARRGGGRRAAGPS